MSMSVIERSKVDGTSRHDPLETSKVSAHVSKALRGIKPTSERVSS